MHGQVDQEGYFAEVRCATHLQGQLPVPVPTAQPCWERKQSPEQGHLPADGFSDKLQQAGRRIPCCFRGAMLLKKCFVRFADAFLCCSIAGLAEKLLLLGHTASLLAALANKARLTNFVVLTSP